MTDAPDARLLEQFAENGSEEAFAALVQRHIGLVHSVALRHTANPQHAEDITQAVFIILARKAGALGGRRVLAGWLYHTARLAAANWQRAEARRVRREQEAFMQSTLEETATDALWQELRPQLDEAMDLLGAGERDALVLRYFQNKSMAEVAQLLGLAENTAQKRVCRALEKLRKLFAKRGVDSTAAGIAEAISIHSVQPVSVALAKTVTAVAAAKGASASASTITLIKGALKIMAWTKAKTLVVAAAGVLLAVGTTTVAIKMLKIDDRWFVTQAEVLDKVPENITVLRRSHWGKSRNGGGMLCEKDRMVAYNWPLESCISFAENFSGNSRLILPENFPQESVDVLITLPKNRDYHNQDEIRQTLRDEIKTRFGYVARRETRQVEAFALRVKNPDAPALHRNANLDDSSAIQASVEGMNSKNFPLDWLAGDLEPFLKVPVIDQTGLTNRVVLDLRWKKRVGETQEATVMQVVRDELGLELVPTNMPIEMLVVEKAK